MKTLKTIIVSLVLINEILYAQITAKAFTLKEAIEYAYQHNNTCLSAQMDEKISKARNWEYTGIGLPQVSASFDLKD